MCLGRGSNSGSLRLHLALNPRAAKPPCWRGDALGLQVQTLGSCSPQFPPGFCFWIPKLPETSRAAFETWVQLDLRGQHLIQVRSGARHESLPSTALSVSMGWPQASPQPSILEPTMSRSLGPGPRCPLRSTNGSRRSQQ